MPVKTGIQNGRMPCAPTQIWIQGCDALLRTGKVARNDNVLPLIATVRSLLFRSARDNEVGG